VTANRDDYRVIADKIISNDSDLVIKVQGGVYVDSIEAGNEVATKSDVGENGIGPTGPTGPAGATGPLGSTGPTGPTGADGADADIADFTFTNVDSGESSVTLEDKDFTIETTNTAPEIDADINLYSADDIQIVATDNALLEAGATANLRLYAGQDVFVDGGSGGEFLGPTADADKQIATVGDISPSEVSYTVSGGTTGTQPTFDGDPLFAGAYVQQGPMVHFDVQVDFDNITSFGSGQYFVSLPTNAKYAKTFRDGCLHDASNSDRSYHISGHVDAGSNQVLLFTTDVQGNRLYDFAFEDGEPFSLTTADNFHISGFYISE